MNCNKYRDLIPLYGMRGLDNQLKEELKKHLETCPDCRNELESISKVINALYTKDVDSLTEIEKIKMERELYRQMATCRVTKFRPKIVSYWPKMLLRVAAVFVVFLLGFMVRHIISIDKDANHPEYQIAESTLVMNDIDWSDRPGLRFSAAGFKVIARGKSALKKQ